MLFRPVYLFSEQNDTAGRTQIHAFLHTPSDGFFPVHDKQIILYAIRRRFVRHTGGVLLYQRRNPL